MEKQYRKPPADIATELRTLADLVEFQASHAFVAISEMRGWEEKGRAFMIDLRWEFKPRTKEDNAAEVPPVEAEKVQIPEPEFAIVTQTAILHPKPTWFERIKKWIKSWWAK